MTRPVIKLGSLILSRSWVLEHNNNRKRLVIETLPGACTGSTRPPSYLRQNLHFLWRSWNLDHNGWVRKPCSCFPRLSCNPERRRGGPWSSCSTGLIKGSPGLLPLFFRGWRHCCRILPRSSYPENCADWSHSQTYPKSLSHRINSGPYLPQTSCKVTQTSTSLNFRARFSLSCSQRSPNHSTLKCVFTALHYLDACL